MRPGTELGPAHLDQQAQVGMVAEGHHQEAAQMTAKADHETALRWIEYNRRRDIVRAAHEHVHRIFTNE